MDFIKITAIICTDRLECLEQNLKKKGVRGVTVSKVKGYGEYTNFFGKDWLSANAKIEIFSIADRKDLIVSTIIECAHTGGSGDGIVAVESVESIYRIRTRDLVTADSI